MYKRQAFAEVGPSVNAADRSSGTGNGVIGQEHRGEALGECVRSHMSQVEVSVSQEGPAYAYRLKPESIGANGTPVDTPGTSGKTMLSIESPWVRVFELQCS